MMFQSKGMDRRVFALLVLLMASVLVLSACAGGATPAAEQPTSPPEAAPEEEATSPPAEEETIVIGVAMRTQTQPRWEFDVESMRQQAEEMGNVELRVQWAADDAARQASQVENLLSQGVDALIVVAVNDRAATPFVEQAHAAGVPVVAYDIGIPDSDVDFFATRNNRRVGEIQVEQALEFAPPNPDAPPNYGLIKGDPDNNVGREIAAVYDEMLTPLAEAGEVNLVADQWHENWSGEAALNTVESALAKTNDDMQAFVTSNDSMALGVAQGVQARGLEGDVYISGLDVDVPNARLIVEGVIHVSVWTRIDEMGRRAVQAAVALAQGEEPQADGTVNNGFKDVPAALIEVVGVTRDNMCEWITEIAPAGWVTVDDVYVDQEPPEGCQ